MYQYLITEFFSFTVLENGLSASVQYTGSMHDEQHEHLVTGIFECLKNIINKNSLSTSNIILVKKKQR